MKNIYERYQKGKESEDHCLGPGPKIDDLLIRKKINPTQLSRSALRNAIVENYPLNLEIPQKKWGKDLYNFVAEEIANALGIDSENLTGLKFCNCLGTNLDMRGVDCFFTFKNPNNGREAWFEIDITTNDKKDEWKSDLVINVNNFPDHRKDENDYIFELRRISETVAAKLLNDTQTIH